MATVTKSIGTTARDYSTITSWEAALNGASGGGGNDAVGECYDDSAFDETVTIDDATPDSVTLTVASAERHDGTAGTGARISRSTLAAKCITLAAVNVSKNLYWLEIDLQSAGQSNVQSYVDGYHSTAEMHITHLLMHGATSFAVAATDYVRMAGAAGTFIADCMMWDSGEKFTGGSNVKTGISAPILTCKVFNCTVHNVYTDASAGAARGIVGTDRSTFSARNCMVTDPSGNTPVCYSPASFATATVDYNLASDTTASGTGSLDSKASGNQYVSTVVGSEDLHLKIGSDAFEAGVDLVTTPSGVEIDIDGRNRDTEGDTWSMGACQLEFASGPSIPILAHHYRQMMGVN